MPVERRNPLPIGRYWVDLIGTDQITQFGKWVAQNTSSVLVEGTETDAGNTTLADLLLQAWTFTPEASRQPNAWALFKVTTPVAWNGPGLPQIADAGVTSRSDTIQAPDLPKEPADRLDDAIDAATSATGKTVLVVAGVAALVGLGYLFVMSRGRR